MNRAGRLLSAARTSRKQINVDFRSLRRHSAPHGRSNRVHEAMIKDFLLLTIFPGAMALAAASDLFTMTFPNGWPWRWCLLLPSGAAGRAWLVRYRAAHGAGLCRARFGLRTLLFRLDRRRRRQAVRRHLSLAWPQTHPLPTASMLRFSAAPLRCCCSSGASSRFLQCSPRKAGSMRLHSPKEGVPYGIALAAAGLLAYRATPFMAALGA